MIARLRRAFTLLETMIAMAILSVSLVAIFDINGMAVTTHVYAKKLTVATLLARSKMIDIEQELFDKGFQTDDDEQAGDFSDDGWPSFKWRAKIIAPKTNGMSPEQLIGAIFNLPIGGGGKDGAPGGAGGLGGLAAMFGGGGAAGASGLAGLAGAAGAGAAGGADAPGGLFAMLGPMAGMAQTQFTQLVDQLTKSVREVHLTVTWKEGKTTESFDIVTHVVSLGVGTSPDRNGGAQAVANAQAAAQSGISPDSWVRADSGQVVPNPSPAPNGQGMVDPASGQPLMQYAQWLATRGGAAAGGAPAIPGAQTAPGLDRIRTPGSFLGGGLGNLPQRVRPIGQ